jgi:hypothetical protein
MDRVYESRDHGCLSVHGGLVTLGRRDRFRAREVIVIAWRERERRSSRFSQMASVGSRAAEMTTRRCSIEAAVVL